MLITLTSIPLSAGASEAEMSVSAKYDVNTQELNIAGNYKMGAEHIVNIFIIPSDGSLEDFSYDKIDIEKNIAFFAEADENGDFNLSMQLPESFETNEYRLWAVSSDVSASTEFLYLNADIADAILQSVSDKSYEEFSQFIADNAKALGIGGNGYHDNSEYINKILYNFMPEEGYSSSEFISRYYKALAMAQYANNSLSLSALIEQYAETLGVDSEAFNGLTENEKNAMEQLIKDVDFTKNELSDVLNNNLLLSRLTGADGYEGLKEVMLKYSNELMLNMVYYNNLSNSYYRDNVFKGVYEENCKTEESFRKAFERESETQLTNQNKENETNYIKSGGGYGGGSSGVSRGGSVGSSTALVTSAAVRETSISDTPKFSDISSHWAENEIYNLAKKGIISGDNGKFRPNDTITRAEFTKLSVMIFDIAQRENNMFDDVLPNDWFAGYVGGAAEAGLINGVGTAFMPYADITREDLCVILMRGLKNKNVQLTGEYAFDDNDEISDYAKEAVTAMASAGIVNGDSGRFRPKSCATRAEAARIIYNILQFMQ